VVRIHTPPLRERVDDIPRLVQHFVRRAAEQLGQAAPSIPAETMAMLQSHVWAGNVRELGNAVERAMILSRDHELRPSAFDLERSAVPASPPPWTATKAPAEPEAASFDLEALEERAIRRALEATGGNRVRASKLLGISERTLRNKLKLFQAPRAS
jgi:DNA-binding NtrC family response regulator